MTTPSIVYLSIVMLIPNDKIITGQKLFGPWSDVAMCEREKTRVLKRVMVPLLKRPNVKWSMTCIEQ